MNVRRPAVRLLREAARVLFETAERLDPPEAPRPATLLGVPTVADPGHGDWQGPEEHARRRASLARHPSTTGHLYAEGGTVTRTPTVDPAVMCLCARLGVPAGEPHRVGCARRPRDEGAVTPLRRPVIEQSPDR